LALVLATSIGLAVVLSSCSVDWSHSPPPQYGETKRSR
jgi:hypothetical protein